ncbi:MAG: branched-chain amino acid ABC transporter ATP-binding protein/permease [Deltaproteobacteria bacterium]|nr:branched-chain amino acid ABC transporter ATP-binding protein/permease [Deltaproteobacteria bacterium]MBW1934357.1 branched-chain amino acid ABC transporter ATP-binding protein/permease [Deltaproteobacteria bacterium]MBW1978465.1 branched-chain amino acid ABC transporter ATP-binding protein/permease [Deltaproteobacteria bacterium]MBW2043459.1 branched-chain amino acid ABC transporter ATP-binding protein/permease [Deltaproteobacteria bacterium]MBW2299421.1 branched-chain amino acid ABC transp
MALSSLGQKKIGDIPLQSLVLILAVVVVIPWIMPNNYWIRIAGNAGLWIMLSLGLNVVAGFAGLLDLGYVAFYAIGGYTYALLCSGHWNIHLPFWLVVPICALAASACGWGLGFTSLRVSGDYLAIVTLGFAEIVRLLLLNLDRPINITGGPNGLPDLDFAHIFGFTFRTVTQYYYLVMFFALLVILASYRLKRSRLGRGWEALREDELAADAMGVNTTYMKLLAFGIGASIAGGAGAVFASWQGGVFPNNFGFSQLVTVYCMLILGGVGNIWGVILAAIILSILPEALREYGAFRMIGYGLLLVVLMALRPQGILGEISLRPKRKKKEVEEPETLKAAEELFYGDGSHDFVKPLKKGKLNKDRVLLELKDLTMIFGGLHAVDRLSLKVYEGEILSIIGPNGAGKTTVFNLITGIYPPTSGHIIFDGKEITGLKPHKVVEKGVARTFQTLRLFTNMTVLENAMVAQHCRTKSGLFSILFRLPGFLKEEERIERVAKENLGLFGARLTGFRYKQKAINLSYANRRRLEIARALATDSRLILLDEPSAGMNPKETEEITRFIRNLRDKYGYTFIIIEHKLNVVRTISDRVIALDYGKKIAEGSYDEVADNEYVVQAYLGRKKGRV